MQNAAIWNSLYVYPHTQAAFINLYTACIHYKYGDMKIKTFRHQKNDLQKEKYKKKQ
jgi:hypothetical protein